MIGKKNNNNIVNIKKKKEKRYRIKSWKAFNFELCNIIGKITCYTGLSRKKIRALRMKRNKME